MDQNLSDQASLFVRNIPPLWSNSNYDTAKTNLNIPSRESGDWQDETGSGYWMLHVLPHRR